MRMLINMRLMGDAKSKKGVINHAPTGIGKKSMGIAEAKFRRGAIHCALFFRIFAGRHSASCAFSHRASSSLSRRGGIERPAPLGFTIIELLLVLSIMALMIGIAIPALNGLGQGNAVSSGASHLAATLALARAKAVTSRSHVRVVFSEDANVNTNLNIFGKISYAILLQTNLTSDIPANWIYLDNWHQVPQGAYFVTNSTLIPQTVPFPTNANVGVTMPCIEFKSTGALTPSSDIDIPIQQGTVFNGALRAGTTNALNVLTNHIFWVTGKAKVLR